MNHQIVARFRKKDHKPQPLWDHLSEVSDRTGYFAGKVGLKDAGQILGQLHDLGKACDAFQNYIRSGNRLIDPDSAISKDALIQRGEIDHSSAGAQLIYSDLSSQGPEGRLAAQILALCIASHHSGLIDCLSPDGDDKFSKRMEKSEADTHLNESLSNLEKTDLKKLDDLLSKNIGKQLVDYLKGLREPSDSKDTYLFKCGLLVRFLLSCLIDADRLNSADFEMPANSNDRNNCLYLPWSVLIQRLDIRVQAFAKASQGQKNLVNAIRNQVSDACFMASLGQKGIYRLTVPTGGGKTFSSLRFALNHAAKHGLDRVFYIMPYTSIIDQNAEEVRKALEDWDANDHLLDRVVLEDHSNLTPDKETYHHSIMAQNWDAPIVFTTTVQFLEALFGSGTRGARRMHQLSRSVIIFDEVQTIPVRCIRMFNLALRFLVQGCGSTVVLCTATQPLLDKVNPPWYALPPDRIQRIIPDESQLFKALKRVDVFDCRKAGGWRDEEVANLASQALEEMGSVLVIVNTRKAARSLFQSIVARNLTDAHVYHLSTTMCPAHRLAILNEVKRGLKDGQPVACVSTQLIEAGIDIDFGSVIRYLAGLDSIAQAAGRSNRHGLRAHGKVWIVNPRNEYLDQLPDIAIGKEHAGRVLREFGDHPEAFGNDRLGLALMERYYTYYFYARNDEMRYRVGSDSEVGREDDLFNLLACNTLSVEAYHRTIGSFPLIQLWQSFHTAAKEYQVIDASTQGVVVPYRLEGEWIIQELCSAVDLEMQYKLLKRAQRYSVNLRPNEFNRLADKKAILEVQAGSGIFFLDRRYYSSTLGWVDDPNPGNN